MMDILPDSRLRTIHSTRHSVFDIHGREWIPAFCANCHHEGPMCLATSTHMFYLCTPCFERMGEITGVMMVPDAEYYAKVAQETHETYGRDLTPVEMAKVREDNDTPLARLLLEAP